jgi:hypothetical protein
MSSLTTVPAELAAAAAQLTAIVSSLTAQNAGAAAPTTAIAPAAADPVSIRQAAIFSAYGTQYQQVAGQAQTTQEQYANTLGLSSGTYASTESSNANQALSDPSFLTSLYNFLGNTSLFGPSGPGTTIFEDEGGNWASAYSDTIGMGGGGLLTALSAPAEGAADLGGLAAGLDGAVVPAGGLGGVPMLAGLGQSSSIGGLSVPPSWAGAVTTVSSTTPMGLPTAGWTAAAPQAAPGIIPGMPGMGAAARNSAGLGAPRYGVKPIVMPKPTTV